MLLQPFWYNSYEYFYEKFENCPDTEEFCSEKQFYYQNLQTYRKNFTDFLDVEATFVEKDRKKTTNFFFHTNGFFCPPKFEINLVAL